MQAGGNTIEIPNEIDTGGEGNIMPLFIFKKLFKNTTEEQLQKSIKSYIRLRTCNKTNITQVGMCVIVIKFKNIKKRYAFFAASENSQVLLRMPDTAALKLININIDSIQIEVVECKTNQTGIAHSGERLCKHRCRFKTKQGANGQNGQNNTNKTIN